MLPVWRLKAPQQDESVHAWGNCANSHTFVIPRRMLQRFGAKLEDAGIDSNKMYKAALLPSTDDDFQDLIFEVQINVYIKLKYVLKLKYV